MIEFALKFVNLSDWFLILQDATKIFLEAIGLSFSIKN